jgi:drug/metabolite transporter (DMT)-like permease
VAPFVLGEPLTRRKLLGLLLGFGGVVLAMHARAGTTEARLPDVMLALLGVIAFVASNVVWLVAREEKPKAPRSSGMHGASWE